jgi:hypothetical protein
MRSRFIVHSWVLAQSNDEIDAMRHNAEGLNRFFTAQQDVSGCKSFLPASFFHDATRWLESLSLNRKLVAFFPACCNSPYGFLDGQQLLICHRSPLVPEGIECFLA